MLNKSIEWYNNNLSRAWPLADTTGGEPGTLPSTLLVDCSIYTDSESLIDSESSSGSSSVYISKLEVTDVGWMLSLTAVDSEGTVTELPRVVSVAFSSEQFSTAKFNASSGGVNLAGKFVIGFPDAVRSWPAITTFTESNGRLASSVVNDVSGLFVTGIEIGGRVLTGTVELVAGDGINFDITPTLTGSKITIRNTKYSAPSANMEITSDTDLIEQLLEAYGNPVRSINGVLPDEDGNISIVIPETEDPDALYITPSNISTGTLVLSISKDPALDENTVTVITEGMAQLNERAARIDSSINTVDRSLNTLATQMTRLS